jgi:hypothetical protein
VIAFVEPKSLALCFEPLGGKAVIETVRNGWNVPEQFDAVI